MDVTFQIPDELVDSVTGSGDLPREKYTLQDFEKERAALKELGM